MTRATGVAVAILTMLIPSCCHAFASPVVSAPSVEISSASVTIVTNDTQQFKASTGAAGATGATATVTAVVDPAVEEAHQQWLAGVGQAAARYGCTPDLIQQLPSETVAEVVSLYVQTAHKGSCLVLLPVSTNATSTRYSFASGGTVDGVEILYLSDVSRVRIWKGAEVTGD
jgi:hypothetical protein